MIDSTEFPEGEATLDKLRSIDSIFTDTPLLRALTDIDKRGYVESPSGLKPKAMVYEALTHYSIGRVGINAITSGSDLRDLVRNALLRESRPQIAYNVGFLSDPKYNLTEDFKVVDELGDFSGQKFNLVSKCVFIDKSGRIVDQGYKSQEKEQKLLTARRKKVELIHYGSPSDIAHVEALPGRRVNKLIFYNLYGSPVEVRERGYKRWEQVLADSVRRLK